MVPVGFLSVTMSRRSGSAFAQRGPPEVVVCLHGDHDLATVAELSAIMAQAMAIGDTDLVVDLSRVTLLTAATVGVLVRARELLRMGSRSLLVRSPSTRARRVLELSDLRGLLEPRSVRVGIERGVEVSMLDKGPKIVLAERVEARRAGSVVLPDGVRSREAEPVMKAAG
jgi:anti-anti-sigma factor